MTVAFDLEPAAERVAALLPGVREEHLGDPTPCAEYTVSVLLGHLIGLSLAFTAAAGPGGVALADSPVDLSAAPDPAATPLDPEWRNLLPRRLRALVRAWQDPRAWQGMTQAGGVDLPAGMAALVVLDELVLHGWDLARATGQRYECDAASTEAVHRFASAVAAGDPDERQGLFGPPVPVDGSAPLFEQALALSGRDPRWSPAAR
jgi:uncharacterized protein (TIGR03086 family)